MHEEFQQQQQQQQQSLFRAQKSLQQINTCKEKKLTIKIDHSHLEIAKANRAKCWAKRKKLQSIKKKKKTGRDFHSHTHTHTKRSGCAHTKNEQLEIINSFKRFLKQARVLDLSESSMEFQTLAPKKQMLNLP